MTGMPSPYDTHDVTNQPPPLADYNVFGSDRCLGEAATREGAGWAADILASLGEQAGSAATQSLARQANASPPVLRTHDRFGNRIDEVEFHPAWHALMTMGMAAGVHSLAWTDDRPGAHVARAALAFIMNHAENGVCCPLAMTFAAMPALRRQPEIAAVWAPRLLATAYDQRPIRAEDKSACTIGMAMTEKQGGSDVRANTTKAEQAGGPAGPGGDYRLTGHKWFCSAPMSDAFLTLAHAPKGLSCFLVPRFLPDGTRNRFFIQRLKDKLGNRSNASAEIEYHDTRARMVGEEGRGVSTIVEMVQHTRLDASISAAAIMRYAIAMAIHHTDHRTAFQRRLADQPLMQAVLADLALESTAATMLVMRLARAFDGAASGDAQQASFARLATAPIKYWVCKRTPPAVFEALECHGGNGYVEDAPIARLYREAPVNSVWEGSGNVVCLDILRAIEHEPGSIDAFRAELATAKGADRRYDRYIGSLDALFANRDDIAAQGRNLARQLALALAGSLMLRHAPPALADGFCATRLSGDGQPQAFGELPSGLAVREIVDYARPLPG